MPTQWFNVRKAAQVAAFFANLEGQDIPVLKLAKLIYLAERESLRRHGFPILNDKFVSMPHGPANSITLNFINGMAQDEDNWSEFITDRSHYSVAAAKKFEADTFDELSEADIECLEVVWSEFGHLDKWQIRDWTHDNCPEWEDPDGSSAPIPVERVLKFLSVEHADQVADEIEASNAIDKVFASLET